MPHSVSSDLPADAMSSAAGNAVRNAANSAAPALTRRRLVLCFDGTANKFQADRSDTNIVKIYQMLKRDTPDQFHYYQPGIGTYDTSANENKGSVQFFPKTRARVGATLDQMFGISFVDHVLGGYKFVMRYYELHDDIYIFGFSRGAYTARFLAEMLHNIGLLSRGNEEMVYFAWDTFSKFQVSKGVVPIGKAETDIQKYMEQFKKTFCKHIEVHFLGLFDCVNSVGQFEVPLFRKSFNYTSKPPAAHIRHAVALHERRLKFRPALCLFNDMDPNKPELRLDEPGEPAHKPVDLKERWFAGNHGDVGGGWDPTGAPKNGKAEDAWLLSDVTLKWMVDEMTSVEVTGGDKQRVLELDADEKKNHLDMAGKLMAADGKKWLKPKPIRTHDMLKWGRGSEWYMWIVWWIIEILPISSRLELQRNGLWKPKYFPPALGSRRGIPKGAKIDESVTNMMECGILGADMQPIYGAPPGALNRLRALLGVRKSGVQIARERHEEQNGTA